MFDEQLPLTARASLGLPNWGRIGRLSPKPFRENSIEHFTKFEYLYFKFPSFGKPKTVTCLLHATR